MAETQATPEELLNELLGGARGIKKWNARPIQERALINPRTKADWSRARLANADLEMIQLPHATLESAELKDARLRHVNLEGASLERADLSGAIVDASNLSKTIFCKSLLWNVVFASCYCRNARFSDADLSGAKFSDCDLRSADFATAIFGTAAFERCTYDHKTQFPAGFTIPDGLIWKGVGPNPAITQAAPKAHKAGAISFGKFVEGLGDKVLPAKLKKATSMLKAERFQLFAEVKDDSLVGVVKSQTNRELVYSCRLASDGKFSCCTQNLLPCGGLQGALCKHLLVLVIGLTRAGDLDPATVDNWINASHAHKPAIDKELMSETLLRYKGAEAGEVDWRPTETIPEDYYAL